MYLACVPQSAEDERELVSIGSRRLIEGLSLVASALYLLAAQGDFEVISDLVLCYA